MGSENKTLYGCVRIDGTAVDTMTIHQLEDIINIECEVMKQKLLADAKAAKIPKLPTVAPMLFGEDEFD